MTPAKTSKIFVIAKPACGAKLRASPLFTGLLMLIPVVFLLKVHPFFGDKLVSKDIPPYCVASGAGGGEASVKTKLPTPDAVNGHFLEVRRPRRAAVAQPTVTCPTRWFPVRGPARRPLALHAR